MSRQCSRWTVSRVRAKRSSSWSDCVRRYPITERVSIPGWHSPSDWSIAQARHAYCNLSSIHGEDVSLRCYHRFLRLGGWETRCSSSSSLTGEIEDEQTEKQQRDFGHDRRIQLRDKSFIAGVHTTERQQTTLGRGTFCFSLVFSRTRRVNDREKATAVLVAEEEKRQMFSFFSSSSLSLSLFTSLAKYTCDHNEVKLQHRCYALFLS